MRVGHRQLSIPSKPPTLIRWGFSFGFNPIIRPINIDDLEYSVGYFFTLKKNIPYPKSILLYSSKMI